MKKSVFALSAMLVIILGSRVSSAGYRDSVQNVVLSTTGMYAHGALGDTFISSNSVEYIGCALEIWSGGLPELVCYAQNSAQQYGSCFSTDPNFLLVAQKLAPDAYVSFQWNSSGYCTSLEVDENSTYSPK
jgi:hypothetical protein